MFKYVFRQKYDPQLYTTVRSTPYLYSIAASITVQYTLCIYLQASNLLQGIEIDLHR